MKLPIEMTPPAPPNYKVLSVSPVEEDHAALKGIVTGAGKPWRLHRTRTMGAALCALRQADYPIVISERDLGRETWRELFESTRRLGNPPFVIVTSLHADERLWAEALNLGAYDVLAKPFDTAEVSRVLELAALRWRGQRPASARSIVVMTARGV